VSLGVHPKEEDVAEDGVADGPADRLVDVVARLAPHTRPDRILGLLADPAERCRLDRGVDQRPTVRLQACVLVGLGDDVEDDVLGWQGALDRSDPPLGGHALSRRAEPVVWMSWSGRLRASSSSLRASWP
jgi:hypothetical protein